MASSRIRKIAAGGAALGGTAGALAWYFGNDSKVTLYNFASKHYVFTYLSTFSENFWSSFSS